MPATVDALVVTCVDSPLHRADKPALAEYLRGKHVGINTWDLLTASGGIRDLVAADAGGRKEALLHAIRVVHDAHGVSKILFVNHSACTAYGGSARFRTLTEEYREHADDLQAARAAVRQLLPNLDIRLFFATVEERADGHFVTIDEVR
ncbi:MAG: hypothetical protein G01um101438_399 [Parcubacteria group bacterium Gr01-1014_38]|nr:MAG: hypothetical protein G01um101438_399 [Parcubacteria group bacterium Gr01-1014_38]